MDRTPTTVVVVMKLDTCLSRSVLLPVQPTITILTPQLTSVTVKEKFKLVC